MPTTTYSKEEYEVVSQDMRSLQLMFSMLGNCLRDKLITRGKFPKKEYDYIPIEIEMLLPQLRFVRDYIEKERDNKKQYGYKRSWDKFLDVGSGPGLVGLAAKSTGFDFTAGVEYNPDVAGFLSRTGKLEKDQYRKGDKWIDVEYYDSLRNNIYCCNAFDFEHYDEYGVIYYYCPLQDKTEQRKLEKLIEDRCVKDTIIIANLKQDSSMRHDDRFEIMKGEREGCQNLIYRKVRGRARKGKAKAE